MLGQKIDAFNSVMFGVSSLSGEKRPAQFYGYR